MVKTAAINIPAEIQQRYHTVTIGMDIMFVNKVAFLITISHGIKFGTVEHIKNRQHDTILNAVKRLKKVYNLQGFQLLHCRADSEFEPLKTEMAGLGVDLNTASEDEHVPEIERYIRTVKERTRSTYNMLPFPKLPSRMIIEMVKASVMWLNMFPAHNGISDTLSPRNIVTGQSVDYKRHCRIETGAYVQTHEEHDNSMRPRTIGAIALRPTGNAQGGYYFLSLSTGRRIHRQHFTELPMPDDVIDRVHQLARQSKAALGLTFGWRDGTEIDEEDDDSVADPNYDPDDEPEEDLSDDEFDNEPDNEDVAPPLAGVADQAIQNNNDNERDEQEEQEQDEQEPDNNQPEEADDIQHPDPAGVVSDHSESDDNDEDDQEDGDASEGDASSSDDEEQIDTSSVDDEEQADTARVDAGNAGVDEVEPEIESQMDERYGERTRQGLRSHRKPDYSKHIKASDYTMFHVIPIAHSNNHGNNNPHQQRLNARPAIKSDRPGVDAAPKAAQKDTNGQKDTTTTPKLTSPASDGVLQPGLEDLEHTALTQCSAKKGLQVFGEAGEEAIISEMQQLDTMDVVEQKLASMLTQQEKKDALEYLMFLKKKRCGRIKGRGCADGKGHTRQRKRQAPQPSQPSHSFSHASSTLRRKGTWQHAISQEPSCRH